MLIYRLAAGSQMDSALLPFEHLQQLEKCYADRKGEAYMVQISGFVDKGSFKTLSAATTKSWKATNPLWFGCWYGLMSPI